MDFDQELSEQLRVQLHLLEKRARDYDEGDEAEALPMSTTVRTLLHDTPRSRSLLMQLGAKDDLEMVDDVFLMRDFPAPEFAAMGSNMFGMDLGLVQLAHYETGNVEYVPADRGVIREVTNMKPFNDWWKRSVMIDGRGNEFSRRNLVLAVANKDGGAHIDLDNRGGPYLGLTQFGAMGWAHENGGASIGTDEKPATDSPVPAAIRQIAGEVIASVRTRFESVLDLPAPVEPAAVRPAVIMTGSSYFSGPPGSSALMGGRPDGL